MKMWVWIGWRCKLPYDRLRRFPCFLGTFHIVDNLVLEGLQLDKDKPRFSWYNPLKAVYSLKGTNSRLDAIWSLWDRDTLAYMLGRPHIWGLGQCRIARREAEVKMQKCKPSVDVPPTLGWESELALYALVNASAALTVAAASTAETSSNFLIRGSLRYIIRRPTCIKTLFFGLSPASLFMGCSSSSLTVTSPSWREKQAPKLKYITKKKQIANVESAWRVSIWAH